MAAASREASTISSDFVCEEHKLWIGNLDNTVTEYQLLQVLKKFGKIRKFEFLFHMHGWLKGKPKGYCFVQFETKSMSETARTELNGKLLHAKRIVVDWAKKQHASDAMGIPLTTEEKQEKAKRENSKEKKIKAIEAKLRLMEQGIETTISNPLTEKYKSCRNFARTGAHPYKQNRKRKYKR